MCPESAALRGILPRILVALSLLAAQPWGTSAAAAQEAEEVFLRLRYEGVVDTVVVGRFAADSIYLPLVELFGILRIDVHYDRNGAATGFFVAEDRPYRIDPGQGIVEVDGTSAPLGEADYRVGDLDLFVLPGLLERTFGLSARLEMRSLTVGVSSPDRLPVLDAVQRAATRSLARPGGGPAVPARSRFGRDPRLFEFGLVQYALRTTRTGQSEELAFDLGAGAKMLGGDLRLATHGSLTGQGLDFQDRELRWRQALDAGRLATLVELGHLFQGGLSSTRFFGARVTNEPVEPRRISGRQILEGETGPDWEVEIYRDVDLIGYTRADSRGRYRFEVPLSYGTTPLRIREYGPTGQAQVTERRFETPFSFLPAGETDYQLSAGRLVDSDVDLFAGSVASGLNERITGRLSVDWRREAGVSHPLYAGGLTARLGLSHLFEMEVAPGAYWRGRIDLFPSYQSTLGASFIRYDNDPFHNPSRRKDEFGLRGYFPAQLGRTAASFRVGLGTSGWLDAARSAWFDLETAASSGPLRSVLGYRRSVTLTQGSAHVSQSDIELGTTWSVTRPPAGLRMFRGLVLDGLVAYDQARRSWRSVRIAASASFRNDSHVNLTLTRELDRGQTSLGLRLVLRPSFLSATTSARRSASGSSLSQEVRGTVAYDASLRRLVPTGREWLGRGGMSLRMFVDADADGVIDPDEMEVPAPLVRFGQPVRLESSGSVLRVHDLLPFHRYEGEIDITTISDPALVPDFTAFSFISEPNIYRRIDVPLREAGVVEGRVLRRIAVGYEGVGGLRVHLRREGDTETIAVQTFTDGGFYAHGLPPGRYEVTLDSAQLDFLVESSQPRVQTVAVTPTSGGRGSELRFALEPQAAEALEPRLRQNLVGRLNDDTDLQQSIQMAARDGEFELAIDLCHRVLLDDPDDGAMYFQLGALYLASADLTRARDAYRRAHSLGSPPSALRELGLVLLELGDTVEAGVILRQVLEDNPDDAGVRSALAALGASGRE